MWLLVGVGARLGSEVSCFIGQHSWIKSVCLYPFQQRHYSAPNLISIEIFSMKFSPPYLVFFTKLVFKTIFVDHKFRSSYNNSETQVRLAAQPPREGPPASLYFTWCLAVLSSLLSLTHFGWNRMFPSRCVLTQKPGFKHAFVKTNEQWTYSVLYN